MAGLFHVLWGQSDNKFKSAAVLTGTDNKPLIIPIEGDQYQTENICTRPVAVDWDGDEDLDLVVGNFAGSFYLFTGEGKGNFNPEPVLIKTPDNKPLKVPGMHSDPFVIDWDGDGDLDLLSGSNAGGVYWAENTAAKGHKRPLFKGFELLIKTQGRVSSNSFLREEDITGPTVSTRIWVDDVNSDGKLDILVGDRVSLTSPANGLSETECQQKLAEWEKEQAVLMAELNNPKAEKDKRQEVMKRYSAHYQQRRSFVTQTTTGFVWLYIQK